MSTTVYGAGMAAWLEPDAVLELRDGHPASHAGFELAITERDGIVTGADLGVGFMHRGAEKLFESRDYRQLMMLANRHDWLSSFHSELLIALALEQSMGIVPPERATWSRMALAEANRAAVTLAFIAPVLDDTARSSALQCREAWVQAQEAATGSRVHPMFTRIGGVAAGLDHDALVALSAAAQATSHAWPLISSAVEQVAQNLTGLAHLDRDQAIAYGTSGNVAHASGLLLDLRRDQPYLAYRELAGLLPDLAHLATDGDAATRYRVLAAQVPASIAIMRASLEHLAALQDQPFDVTLPKTVRAPEGTSTFSIEGPIGIMSCLLVSDADRMPWRLRLRTASYNNAQAMQAALVGSPVERLAEAVMSFPFVVGDIDR